MAAAQDVEISLGTGRLLALFFALVVVCGIFFGLGYTLGRSTGPSGLTAEAAPPAASSTKPKPASGAPADGSSASSDLTFYKRVEQKDAAAQLAQNASSTPAPAAAPTAEPAASTAAPEAPHAASSSSSYVVQVAAVSKKEDAEALAAVLRKKNYPVFVAGNAPSDALVHVQVGPFNDLKEAEAMRTRLTGDGYNPIVKK